MSGADHTFFEHLDTVGRDASDLRRQRRLLYSGGAILPLATAPVVVGGASAAFLAVGALGIVLPLGGLAGRGGPIAVARARRERDRALHAAIARGDEHRIKLLLHHGVGLEANRVKRVDWLMAQVPSLVADPRLRDALDGIWYELRPILHSQPNLGPRVVDRVTALGDVTDDTSARTALLDVMANAGIDANSSAGRAVASARERWGAESGEVRGQPSAASSTDRSASAPAPAPAPVPVPVRRQSAPPARTVDEAIAKMISNDGADGLIAVGELRSLIAGNPENARRLVAVANEIFVTLRDGHRRAGDASILAGVVVKAFEELASTDPANAPVLRQRAGEWTALAHPRSLSARESRHR